MTTRGGAPDLEIEHGKLLLKNGAPETWGWSTPAGEARVARRVEWFRQSAGLGPGVRALECGCGTGIFTRRFAALNADITAVDISLDLLGEARQLCTARNVDFRQTNLENPVELEDNSFDVIYGVSVLHHLSLEKALPALFSKLKLGGRFVFSEPNLLNPINRYLLFVDDLDVRKRRGVSPNEMAFTPHELRQALERAGFRVESLECRDFMHPSVPELLIPPMQLLEAIAESTPLLRNISGSLWVVASKPDPNGLG
jgi:SAM-dependent methyltransferase